MKSKLKVSVSVEIVAQLSKLPNKRFKRDSQRVAFLLCVGFCGYGVMRQVGNSVGSPLSGRYNLMGNHELRRVSRIGF